MGEHTETVLASAELESRSPCQLCRGHSLPNATQWREISLWPWMNCCRHQLEAGHYVTPFHHIHQLSIQNPNQIWWLLWQKMQTPLHEMYGTSQSCPNVLSQCHFCSLTLTSRDMEGWGGAETRHAIYSPAAFLPHHGPLLGLPFLFCRAARSLLPFKCLCELFPDSVFSVPLSHLILLL